MDGLCWDPRNRDRLATASADKSVRFWDVRSGKSVAKVATRGPNLNVAWHPDGSTLAVGDRNDVISFVDTRKFRVAKTLENRYEVNEMAWSPAADLFLITTEYGTVEVYRSPGMKRLKSLPAHTSHCTCVAFDNSDRYFAVGGSDALVSLWDVESMACTRTYMKLDKPIKSVGFSHDGRYLAYASDDALIDVADVRTGETVKQLACKGSVPEKLAWNPKHLAFAFAGGGGDFPVSVVTPN